MKKRELLTSAQVAKRAGLSVEAFYANKKIYDSNDFENSITNKRGKKCNKTGIYKPYWYLNDTKFGINKENSIRWFSDKIDELFLVTEIGSLTS